MSAASGRRQLLLLSDAVFIAQLERFIPGISTKILTERLRRMLAYGLITRTEYPELPLRVEYHLTPIGEKLASVIEQLRALETELSRSSDRS